jgi:hypothetical protein
MFRPPDGTSGIPPTARWGARDTCGQGRSHACPAGCPRRKPSSLDDPFYPGVQAFAAALPENPGGAPAELAFAGGCHTDAFFNAQEPPSLAFLARHLVAPD